jgi:hypothetical protein
MDAPTVGVSADTARVLAIARAVELRLAYLWMSTSLASFAALFLVQAAGDIMPRTMTAPEKKALLVARESVWRSFFSNDRTALDRLIPEETIVMDAGSAETGTRASVLKGAAQFAKSGAKLLRLEFPTTAIQCYGSVAIVYSTYFYELEDDAKRTAFSGRITEVFVFRKDHWVNPGWHMEPVSAAGVAP